MKKSNTLNSSSFLLVLFLALSLPAVLSTYFSFQINTIVSGSMRPAIDPGDAIITIVKEADALNPGDVVLLFDPRANVVQAHRITQETVIGEQIEITTKGDANTQEDMKALVSRSTPIRTSVFVLPGFGNFLSNVTRRSGAIVAFLFVAIFLIAAVGATRKTNKSNSIQKRNEHV